MIDISFHIATMTGLPTKWWTEKKLVDEEARTEAHNYESMSMIFIILSEYSRKKTQMAYVASLLSSHCVPEDQNVLQRRSLMKETEGSGFGLVAVMTKAGLIHAREEAEEALRLG
jgi:hypothetical protein